MAHKLLHTLVFSSALALEAVGCASAPAAPLRPPRTPTQVAVSPPAQALAVAEPPAATTSAEAEQLAAWRSCEEGWPTTKGTTCSPAEGPDGTTVQLCCGATYNDPRCCVTEDAQ